MSGKKIWMVRWGQIGLLVLLVLLVVGCQPQRKPAPATDNTGRLVPAPGATQTLPVNPAEASALARRLAARAAQVDGVNRATVVLSGNTAMVGLDIKAKLPKSRIDAIKKEVAAVIKKEDTRIRDVLVSTDADMVTRLKKIASGINEGRPVSSFRDEINDIMRRLSPVAR
ncbi:MAG: YhcN/YlaJ family sporulation lipoprotein [Desulfurispora sp.]|uniref:YhcN/YlaJ family sporulation lipoprotein n=1 Tax=Desulfurispora sp. TaxID=3014275 RepID=UPI0040495071